ncbi:sulfoxide reductase heme-binding subunit YedZ [Luteimonas sp. J16]|nr:sulfoxide reductase heme-binding subunit YedZ [Luteimonas sp. J16]
MVLKRGPRARAVEGAGARPGRGPDAQASLPLVAAKLAVHLLALLPLGLLAWKAGLVLRGIDIDALGPDPVAAIEHALGQWALRLLLLTLAVTPLRQLTGQPVLLRFRRMLGLYAFAYASLHFAAWLGLDLAGYWAMVFGEIAKRPYITVGFAAWLLLVPLALTSTRGWMRRLGRHWGRLHRLVYAVAVFAVLHFWWIVKSDYREPLLYACILALLLGWRLWTRLARRAPRRASA